MHKRGMGYQAKLDTGSAFYTNTEWERVPVEDVELDVKAGSKLEYYCDYRNTESRHIYQGTKTTDEMCMLIGSYYPADPRTANCLDESGKLPGGDWVGQGTATCKDTLTCVQGSAGNLQGVTDCVMAAKPDVSAEMSAALRCFMGAQNPFAECGPQIQACSAK